MQEYIEIQNINTNKRCGNKHTNRLNIVEVEDFGVSPLARDPASRDLEVNIHLHDVWDKHEQVEELV